MKDEQCCVVTCENPLDQTYWDNQYQANTTGWDLGEVAPPLKHYINTINDINCAILIPGCGNTYEAEYLLEQGFTNVTIIDIAPTLVEKLKNKFDNKNIKIILGDFFEHQGQYDLIIEQTFFCALPPTLRQKYVYKMHQLLAKNGILAGLFFNRNFEISPPFGGNKAEYEQLFKASFEFLQLDVAENSILQRANTELFFEFKKNSSVYVTFYKFQGITCSSCKKTVTDKLSVIDGVLNVSMNTDFTQVLIVSQTKIAIETFHECISYDALYKISLIK